MGRFVTGWVDGWSEDTNSEGDELEGLKDGFLLGELEGDVDTGFPVGEKV